MTRRLQSPASSLSHFLLPEASSCIAMSPKAEASAHPRPTHPNSQLVPHWPHLTSAVARILGTAS